MTLSPWSVVVITANSSSRDVFAAAPPATYQRLIRHHFDEFGYTLQVTDLEHVWTEQLDQRRVIGRALDEDTPIDPSEDASQLKLLLRYVRETLTSDGSSSLHVYGPPGSRLELQGCRRLPSPLRNLKWPFRLACSDANLLASDLVAPLFALSFCQTWQTDYLVKQLQQKDAAIAKLLDRIENSGADLASAFPALLSQRSGRHTPSRSHVFQQAPDLSPFDVADWKQSARFVDTAGQTLRDVVDTVMTNIATPDAQTMTNLINLALRPRSRPDKSITSDAAQSTSEIVVPPNKSPPTPDDFQRQTTPPNLARSSSIAVTPAHVHADETQISPFCQKPELRSSETFAYRGRPTKSHKAGCITNPELNDDTDLTTDDDGDLNITSDSAKLHSSSPVKNQTSRADIPEATQQTTNSASLQSLPPRRRLDGLRSRGDETSMQSNPETNIPSSPPLISPFPISQARSENNRDQSQSPSPKRPAFRKRLGRLGGASHYAPPASGTATTPEQQDPDPGEPSSRHKGKQRVSSTSMQNVIGQLEEHEDDHMVPNIQDRGAISQRLAYSSAPVPNLAASKSSIQDEDSRAGRDLVEDDQDTLADRKRDELKRQLADAHDLRRSKHKRRRF